MTNAFRPIVNRALNVLGALIREWSLDANSRPPHIMEKPRLCVIGIDDFRAALSARGLTEGVHFEFRDGVDKVELLLPAPDRFTIAMPEAEALTRFAIPGQHDVQVPAIYGAAAPGAGNPTQQVPDENGPASYVVTVDDQTFDKFVDPYMAAYVCTQCA